MWSQQHDNTEILLRSKVFTAFNDITMRIDERNTK